MQVFLTGATRYIGTAVATAGEVAGVGDKIVESVRSRG
jgi:hypothetical protein